MLESDAPSGGRSWIAAAVIALLIGAGAGFATGYIVGWRGATRAAVQTATDAPEPAATSGRAFTDAPVSGAAPEQVPSASAPGREPRTTGAAVPASPATDVPARIEPPPASTPIPAPGPAEPRGVPPADREQDARRLTGNGSLLIESRPIGAQVRVDGTVVGRTPLVLTDIRPGSHSIGLELPGYNRWATTTVVDAGVRTRVAASLEQ